MYNGNTALHLIVGRALPEKDILFYVNLLMNHGANVGLENAEKEKALDLVHREHVEVCQLVSVCKEKGGGTWCIGSM